MNAVHPPLKAVQSAMDRPFDRLDRAFSMPDARRLSLGRILLFVVVVTLHVVVVLGVVQSTIGLGYESGAGIGPVPIPAPAPAGA